LGIAFGSASVGRATPGFRRLALSETKPNNRMKTGVDDHERISAQVMHPNVGLRKLSTNLQNQLAQPIVLSFLWLTALVKYTFDA